MTNRKKRGAPEKKEGALLRGLGKGLADKVTPELVW